MGDGPKALRAALSPRPILFVEDDSKDAELIREALRAAGFPNSVVVCKDGTSAITLLSVIEHNEPCVVLVDRRLPGTSGFDVLATMKADPAMRDVPVVIMTGSRHEEDVVLAYSLGANVYVVKPFGVTGFLELARARWLLAGHPHAAAHLRWRRAATVEAAPGLVGVDDLRTIQPGEQVVVMEDFDAVRMADAAAPGPGSARRSRPTA